MPKQLKVSEMSDEHLIRIEMQSGSLLNQVRRELSFSAGKIEQASAQRTSLGPIELRRMEFEAAEKIIAMVREWD